jgi:hypothetical protein
VQFTRGGVYADIAGQVLGGVVIGITTAAGALWLYPPPAANYLTSCPPGNQLCNAPLRNQLSPTSFTISMTTGALCIPAAVRLLHPERAVLEREVAVGASLLAYLVGKQLWHLVHIALMTLAYLGALLIIGPFRAPPQHLFVSGHATRAGGGVVVGGGVLLAHFTWGGGGMACCSRCTRGEGGGGWRAARDACGGGGGWCAARDACAAALPVAGTASAPPRAVGGGCVNGSPPEHPTPAAISSALHRSLFCRHATHAPVSRFSRSRARIGRIRRAVAWTLCREQKPCRPQSVSTHAPPPPPPALPCPPGSCCYLCTTWWCRASATASPAACRTGTPPSCWGCWPPS